MTKDNLHTTRTSFGLLHSPLRYFFATCTLVLLTAGAGDPGSPTSSRSNNDLRIVIGGINSFATNEWFGDQSVVSQSKERWVIVSDKANRRVNISEDGQGMSWNSNMATVVPDENYIYFNPNDPASVKKLKEIGSRPDAAVFIDMKLSVTAVSTVRRVWDQETDWAATAACLLATSHKENTRHSTITLFGHSAGTEAVSKAQEIQQNQLKNKSIDQRLFDQSIAASPRDYKRFYDKETIMIIADGDFTESPGGFVGDRKSKAAFGRVGKEDAELLAEKGFKVLRVKPDQTFNPLESHNIVHQLSRPGLEVEIYSPDLQGPRTLPSTSLGNVLQKISNATDRIDKAALNTIEQYIKREMPTENLGGISLNAVATFPVDPAEIENAGFDENKNRLYAMINGKRIYFPYIDPEVLHLSYQCAYLRAKKPELSIGSSPFSETVKENGQEVTRTTTNLPPPGMQAVYYLGQTENTYLGLAMFLADQALGRLSFSAPSAEIRAVSQAVPGFHSLPELFPAKYAHHPIQNNYLGYQRIFLYSKKVDLLLNQAAAQFEIRQTVFEVQFEKEGPAEQYFSSFLSRHFNAIANTPQGAALKNLVPFVHAVAIFRWLKLNNVQVDENALTAIPITKVFTPKFTTQGRTARLEDLSPSYPTILYGPHGPNSIHFTADRSISFTYRKGLPVDIHCSNGNSLHVYRDETGLPFAWKTNKGHTGVFMPDKELGPVIFENVKLEGPGQKLVAGIDRETIVYPENQPEAAFRRVLAAFIKQNEKE